MRLHSAALSLCLGIASIPGFTLAVPVPANAQTQSGSISGSVVGSQGAIRGATVTASGPVTRSVTTNADGSFTLGNLPDGTYAMSASFPGYQPLRGAQVTISGGKAQTLSVTLVAQTLSSLRTIGSTAVTGGRGSTALNTTAAAQVTVSSQQFQDRGETQVADLLEEQPGVELEKNDSGALGANTEIALRGANPYETQVLIDGHPVNGGRFGDYLLQFLNPLLLSDVEIDKGPGAFGNTDENAVGGRVNFRTPSITATPSGIVQAGYDSFNGSEYAARFSDTIGKFGFLVGYAFDGTPGYFANQPIYTVDPTGQYVQGQPPPLAVVDQAVQSSETYQNRSELVKLGYNFSTTTTLTLGYFGSQSYVDYSGTLGSVEPYHIVASCPAAVGCQEGSGTIYTNPADGFLVGQTILAADYPNGDNVFQGNTVTDSEPIFTADLRTAIGPGTFLGRFYGGSIRRVITDPQEVTQIAYCANPSCIPVPCGASGTTLDCDDFTEAESDELHGYDFEYDVPVGLSTLIASYDTHNDKSGFVEDGDTSLGLLVRSQVLSLRGFVPIAPHLTLGVANYFSNTTFVGKHYDPDASLTWQPSRNQVIRFSGGSSFVAPPAGFVSNVAGATGQDTGAVLTQGELHVTDNLRPEFSTSFDLGTDYRTSNDSKITLDLYNTIVQNRFADDVIKFVPPVTATFNGQPVQEISELFNQADSHEQGIELGFLKTPRVGFGGSLVFDFLRAYDYDTIPNPIVAQITGISASSSTTGSFNGLSDEEDGFQIPGYPYSHGHAELNYRFPSGASVAFGSTYYGDYNSFGESAFELFDAHARLPLAHGFTLLLSGTNVFNHDDGRGLYEFENGEYTPPAAPGKTESPVNLLFAPPRQVTLQISHPL